MSKRKQLTLKIAIGLLVFLLICTVVSQTVYRMLLPVVETVDIREGNLGSWVEETGKLTWSDQKKIIAGGNWEITEVLVKKGAIVTAGTPLFRIDERQAEIDLEKAELEILKLQNQLSENSVSNTEQGELELQIQIAEKELEAWENDLPFSNDIKELELKLAIIELENQEEVDEQSLKLAKDQLASYQRKGAGVDTAELLKLDKKIAGLEKQLLSSSLSQEKREKLEAELQIAREDREFLSIGHEDYDPLYEESLRQEVMKAEQNLKGNVSERDRSVLELKKEIAQEQLILYQQREEMDSELQQKKLQLTLTQLKNQLAGKAKTASEKQELSQQISIARKELELQKAAWPQDGVVKAPIDGTVTRLAVKEGETISKGKAAAVFSTGESKPCVTWELSAEAAEKYSSINEAQVTIPRRNGGGEETLTLTISDRVQDEETNTWKLTAPLELSEEQRTPGEADALRVRMTIPGKQYDCVIPLSCLREDSYGKPVVLVLKSRQGIFSEERYLSEVSVEVLEKNNLNAAVKSAEFDYGTQIVHYSSKAVSAGSVVSVGTVE